MRLIFIRHGMTPGNRLSRYIGSTNESLSPEGVAQAEELKLNMECERVYVSPLIRTRQTARILFPYAGQFIIKDFREMDFGAFENRSAAEMEQDPQYRRWVDGGCLDTCPGGESRNEFCSRVCDAFEKLIQELRKQKTGTAVFVVHGGTIMAILERFAIPKKEYYEYHIGNCGIVSCRLMDGDEPLLCELEFRVCFPGCRINMGGRTDEQS